MSILDGIFSLRIVTVDFYMETPKPELDPCFSEFRGRPLQKVPIVRIFGSTAEGLKTCMHVHGVFPYMYIPFDRKDFGTLDKAVYLVASSIDKAINISLGQSSSESQHVFEIQLVKGIPFYGYHQKEHQYLKIYMLNPRFIRRAANLLQNGAVMGKTIHPHESHVPYILQFFIDYNLYGMSFLHVPIEVLKFRWKDNHHIMDMPYKISKEQILDCNIAAKISTSKFEVDIGCGFILNRFQLQTKTSTHANPGIESIWQDERVRRQNLDQDLKTVPPLVTPPSQDRPDVESAKSEDFYREGLQSKLQHLEISLNQTMSNTLGSSTFVSEQNSKEKKQTFNLKKIIANAVYPEECTQNDMFTDASFITNHFSNGSFFETSNRFSKSITTQNSDDVFLDDTIVDEELIRSLTQSDVANQTLREEDKELLDVMQHLEKEEDENIIDLDSTLAAFSPNINVNSPTHMMVDKISTTDLREDESDNECTNDFTTVMDDMDELLIKLSQSTFAAVEQCDKVDSILRTPKKSTRDILQNAPNSVTPKRINQSNTKSPRTNRTVRKYAPLSVHIQPRSAKKNLTDAVKKIEVDSPETFINHQSGLKIKKLKLRETAVDLDGTQITCKLRLIRRKSETRLKTYKIEHIKSEPLELFSYQNDSERKIEETPCKNLFNTSLNDSKSSYFFNFVNKIQSPSIQCSQNEMVSIPLQLSSEVDVSTPKSNLSKTISRVNIKRCSLIKDMNQISPQISSIEHQSIRQKKLTPKSKLSEISPRVELKRCSLIHNMILNTPRSSKDLEITYQNSNAIELNDVEISKIEKRQCPKPFSKKKSRLSLKSRKQFESYEIVQKSKHSFEDDSIRNINVKSYAYDDVSNKCEINFKECSQVKIKKVQIRLKRLKIEDIKRSNTYLVTPTDITNENSNKMTSVDCVHACDFKNTVVGSPRTVKTSPGQPLKVRKEELCEHAFIVGTPRTSKASPRQPSKGGKEELCENSLSKETSSYNDLYDFQNVFNTHFVIKPKVQTETFEEVERNCDIYDIPDMIHQQPFYSNCLDIASKMEIGQTLLYIPSASLNDVEDFKTTISGLKEFSGYRKTLFQAAPRQLQNADRIREYFSTDKIIISMPSKLPPSKQEAKIWLKATELLKETNLDEQIFDENSPIKIRRQKVAMLLVKESNDMLEDVDCSMQLTPNTDERTQTQIANKAKKSARKKVNFQNKHKVKVSSSNKLRKVCLSNALENSSEENTLHTKNGYNSSDPLKISYEDEFATGRESTETVSSEAVLAELEKVSFVNNLHNSRGSFDCSFGISNATLSNNFGFKVNLENLQQAKSDVEHNYLTTLSLEIFVSTRGDLLPNPQFDAIVCIFYAIENSIPSSECSEDLSKTSGFIIMSDGNNSTSTKFNGIDSSVKVKEVATEIEGLIQLLDVCSYWDPDIFVGYEIEMSSWGYVMERAKFINFDIAPLLSRVPTHKVRDMNEDRDQLTDLDVETKLCGRILLDVWRLMRSEIALTSYTFENVMYHILHRRCPLHTHKNLSKWFNSPQTRWIVLEYYLERVRGTLELIDHLDIIGRTSEMAKLIGIQFYEILSRGSQFRVESMMLRIAKPRNFVPLSPSVQQRAHMRAPEYLPLILEPQSRFYSDPMIVLDFQSLYPSMIMAYNYCFSTCLGRVEHLGQSTPFEFGASQLRVSPMQIEQLLKNQMVTISPCGVVFVKREFREGILPRMLSEILDTRQMVKQSMKLHKESTALQRILHSRQLGLKLMANVTYGYTAANFSGRMPCVEVGDSVVAKGRETLERAIKLVEGNKEWNVKVVYGDTDSLFVLVPGRSKSEAFKIGSEIAELVTQRNPQPVKLKLEKVYQPCILQTKKRYVGYMFESPDQKEPIYEAKGIETVRRDGCPAAVKMLEKTLRILFDSADVSQVKTYICRQFTKLLSGKANIQDLIFAKEFRGLKGYKPTACVPALEMTRKWMLVDPRKIPRRGERVPFIVTHGPPGLPLIKLVRSPRDVLADEGLKINAIYYITKAIIPPLNRCLLLLGADVNDWFASLPRKTLFAAASTPANIIMSSKKSTISQYFNSTNCIIDCGRQTKQMICSFCSINVSNSLVTLEEKISKIQRGYFLTKFICQSCCGRLNYTNCSCYDCPVLYVLEMKKRDLNKITEIRDIANKLF